MNQAFVELNGVRTKVVTIGRWIEESCPHQTNDIIILIPGNPGITGFYKDFAKTLYERTRIPVWCIGQAGHNFSDQLANSFDSDTLGLQAQIDGKLDFFRKYVPVDAKVWLMGHSIGAYMCVEILDHPDVSSKIKQSFLLFPTVERMADTINGKLLNYLARPLFPLLMLLVAIVNMLPQVFINALLWFYMYMRTIPKSHEGNLFEVLKTDVLRNVLMLAFEEMDKVRERNDEVIRRNLRRLKFLYGRNDNWAPKAYFDRIKQDLNVEGELTDFDHAFVINSSEAVADRLVGWMRNN